MNEQAQNEINAVKILAKASEFYLTTIDELARGFVTPQVGAAIQILTAVVNERNPQEQAPPAPAPTEPQAEEAAARPARKR